MANCAVFLSVLLFTLTDLLSESAGQTPTDTARFAHCKIEPNSGLSVKDKVRGTIDFRQLDSDSPLEMSIRLTGFNKRDSFRSHGFHAHEFGDLSMGCNSTGGHFNPLDKKHGAPSGGIKQRHVGDFGNLVEDGYGNVVTSVSDALHTVGQRNRVEARYARCDVANTAGITGRIDFRQVQEDYSARDLEVDVNLTGFNPNDTITSHGFHVHTFGDISAGCGGAGGHFNPEGDPNTHGHPYSTSNRHVGDFGNINETGSSVVAFFTDSEAAIFPDYGNAANNILGRAIVIHAHADDFGLGGQPGSLSNGNAGPRIGCCVICAAPQGNWPAPTVAP